MVSKSSEELLKLAKSGVEKWNAWADEYKNWPEDHRQNIDFNGSLDVPSWTGFVFPGPVSFKKCTLSKSANFSGAVFDNTVSFEETTFNSRTSFDSAKFLGEVTFNGAKFRHPTIFRKAEFHQRANFFDATFGRTTTFDHSKFYDYAGFGGKCTFEGMASFVGCYFGETTWFNDTTFRATTIFIGSVFSRPPFFHNTRFHDDTRFGEIDELNFPNTTDLAAEDNFRALKQYMIGKQDHVKGLFFLKREMESIFHKRRGIEKYLLCQRRSKNQPVGGAKVCHLQCHDLRREKG